MMHIHATCVSVCGAGVLLRGPSGAGKSDLALRLIDGGAMLVADDRVELAAGTGQVLARAPAALAGLLEVRGVGILPMPHIEEAPVALVVDLVTPDRVARLPEPDHVMLCGMNLPRLELTPFEASAPAKIRLALAAVRARVPPVPARFEQVSGG